MHTKHRPVAYALLGILVGALVVAVLVLMTRTWSLADQIREQQTAAKSARTTSQATLDAIKDCTTPGRPCYKRGQDQYAKAVGDINRVVVLASACSVGVDPKLRVGQRQSVIQSCIIARLASEAGKS